jgi:hypothetical protein
MKGQQQVQEHGVKPTRLPDTLHGLHTIVGIFDERTLSVQDKTEQASHEGIVFDDEHRTVLQAGLGMDHGSGLENGGRVLSAALAQPSAGMGYG